MDGGNLGSVSAQVVRETHEFFHNGVRFSIASRVFSPARFASSAWLVDQLVAAVPKLDGISMSEPGCGSGFAGQYMVIRHNVASLTQGASILKPSIARATTAARSASKNK